MTLDTTYHHRRVTEKMEDTEYRTEYERAHDARVYCPLCLHPNIRHHNGYCTFEKCDCEGVARDGGYQ
jgi:hypothetical protein